MKRIILLICICFTELLSISHWLSCWQFSNEFYFTPQIMANKLLILTNGEQGVPLILVRILYNKVLFWPWGVLQTLLQYADIRFLEAFLGIVGAVGVALGVWHFITSMRRSKILWTLSIVLVFYSIVEIIFQPNLPYFTRILPLFGIFFCFSVVGYWAFLRKSKHGNLKFIITIILLIISMIFIFAFPHTFEMFCLKV